MPVRLCFPDGQRTWHYLRPSDTPASLLSALRQLHPNLVIGDILFGDRWISSAAKWRAQNLMYEWRLKAGDELVLHPRPDAIGVSVGSPEGGGEGKTVELRSVQTAGEVLKAVRETTPLLGQEEAVMFGQELYEISKGRLQRCIRCYSSKGEYLFFDPETGKETDFASCSFVVRRYLSRSSALPSAPPHIPSLIVNTKTTIFEINARRQLTPARSAALMDPIFVAFIWGVGGSQRFFWRLVGSDFVDGASGELFPSRTEIPDLGPRTHTMCLLRRGDQPPFCNVPPGKRLEVFYRAGVDVSIHDDRLRATEAEEPCDVERWISRKYVHKFNEDLTASARME